MRLVWTGFVNSSNTNTDGFYREWTRSGGWAPMIQLYSTSGKGNTGGLQLAVDSAGVNHVVWDDDTGRRPGHRDGLLHSGAHVGLHGAAGRSSRSSARRERPLPDRGCRPRPQRDDGGPCHREQRRASAGYVCLRQLLHLDRHQPPPTPVPTPCSPGVFSDVPPARPSTPGSPTSTGGGPSPATPIARSAPTNNHPRPDHQDGDPGHRLHVPQSTHATFADVPPSPRPSGCSWRRPAPAG